MKFIFGMILAILGLSLGAVFLPALIGIFIGLVKFDSGNILGGIIAIVIGLVVQGLMFLFIYLDSGSGSGSSHYADDDCPYCGSGDTDGNHCYTCDDDF